MISWTADRNGVVQEENLGWSKFTGQSKADFLANRWLEMVHPEDRARAETAWAWANLKACRYEVNYRLYHAASRDWRWVRAGGVPLLSENNEIESWIGKLDDIHEKVLADLSVARNELHFRSLAETVPAFFWLASRDAQVFYWNPAWYEYTGFTPEQSMGINAANAIREDFRQQALVEWEASVREERNFEMDFPIINKFGEARWFTAKARPILDQNGKLVKWAGAMVDINDHEVANMELRNERQLRERFVATLTHDLRNALTSGKASTQVLLRKAEANSFQEKHHKIIFRCLERIDGMIADLLDANKIRAGHGYLIKSQTKINAEELLKEIADSLNHSHGEHFHAAGVGNTTGFWNRQDITRVVENLAINALKYGDISQPITLKAEDQGNVVAISVHNFGNPISPAASRSLFNFMERCKSDEKKAEGWGIGLTLVTGISDSYGGQVSVKSDPDSGTTFTATFPKEPNSESKEAF